MDGVLIIGGPTAAGKTAMAIALARRFGAEIIGADSRQVYRDMPIGTAAPTAAQRTLVAHHLVGFVDPYERYSAARFVGDAAAAIDAIAARGRRVIVAGGTGFYLRALCGDVALADEPDGGLRARILREARVHPPDVLHAWLAARNPSRAAALSPHDGYRVMRALEIALAGGTAAPAGDARAREALPTLRARGIAFCKLVLHVGESDLAARIVQRTDAMLADGLLEEARHIGIDAVAANAVGYREAQAYDAGWCTYEELRRLLARSTQRYAKRQRTWFRSEPGARTIDARDTAAASALAVQLGWTPVAAAPPVEGEPLPERA